MPYWATMFTIKRNQPTNCVFLVVFNPCALLKNNFTLFGVSSRDASIRYPSFSADQVSVRRDRSKSDIVCILFCVIVKPHESTNIIKHHKVHSLMLGTDEYLSR